MDPGLRLQRRATTVPAPLVVSPSQKFDGADGQWSSFIISVGTPPQNYRVLPSTQAGDTWVISPEGCTPTDVSNCFDLRGGEIFNGQANKGFLTSQSSTWKELGIYSLDLDKNLGYTGAGLYGTDVVGLNGGNSSAQGNNGISFPGQLVAAIADKSFFNGIFGLSVRPTSFSSGGAPTSSFLASLYLNKRIPSVSYGYTAGAAYQNKQTFGSLTLGGYDASRLKNTTKSQPFTFSANDNRALTVGVQSITASDTFLGTASMTTDGGHLSLIDSSVSHLWLPRGVCDRFQQAFGLLYDPQSDLYYVNDTTHRTLLNTNPKITFKLGNTAFDNGNGTNIVLPYAAFDLQVGWPTYNSTLNYFPIRRAANDSQYTLGRTLLQEMYPIVDHDRRNFTIAQAEFPDSGTPSYIVAISPKSESEKSSGIGAGAIAGIVIGIVAVFAAIGLFIFCLRRRKNMEKARIAELENNQIKVDPGYAKVEPTPEGVYETGGTEIQELEGPGVDGMVKEGPHGMSHELATHELASPAPVFEMEGDSTLSSYGRPGSRQQYTPRTPQPQVSPYERDHFPR